MKNIKALIPHIFDLGLNNIKFNGGMFDGKMLNSSDVVKEILRTVTQEGTKIIKLKLTKMNLRPEGIVDEIV